MGDVFEIGDVPSSSELSGLATYKPAVTPRFLAPSGLRPSDPVPLADTPTEPETVLDVDEDGPA